MEGKPTYDCELCNLKFKAPSLLKAHLKTKGHLDKEDLPNQWKCKDCDKEYKRCEDYIIHRLFKKDCVYMCDYKFCNDEFTTKQRLVSHCNSDKHCAKKLQAEKEKLNGNQKLIESMVGVGVVKNLVKNSVRCRKNDIIEFYKNNPIPPNIQ